MVVTVESRRAEAPEVPSVLTTTGQTTAMPAPASTQPAIAVPTAEVSMTPESRTSPYPAVAVAPAILMVRAGPSRARTGSPANRTTVIATKNAVYTSEPTAGSAPSTRVACNPAQSVAAPSVKN